MARLGRHCPFQVGFCCELLAAWHVSFGLGATQAQGQGAGAGLGGRRLVGGDRQRRPLVWRQPELGMLSAEGLVALLSDEGFRSVGGVLEKRLPLLRLSDELDERDVVRGEVIRLR